MVRDVEFPGYIEAFGDLLCDAGDEGRLVVQLQGPREAESQNDVLNECSSHHVRCFPGSGISFNPTCKGVH